MVVATAMGWLSDVGSRVNLNNRSLNADSQTSSGTNRVGILAFEAAKTMSRLVCLYKSLDDAEILKLKEVMKSEGVSYLNSKDEAFLLNLACAERLEDLDKAATTVDRLGQKCSDSGPNRFDLVYKNLKLGVVDLGKLEYASKGTERTIMKMEKLVSATASLYTALESLSELEVSERKLYNWKQSSKTTQLHPQNLDHLNQKIRLQRKQVRHFRETSLWNTTFNKSVSLMVRIVCIVYARICVVFGPYVSFLPHVSLRNIRSSQQREKIRFQSEYCLIEPLREQMITRSGPILSTNKPSLVRFHSQKSFLFSSENSGLGANNRAFHAAGPSTVGGSGLALRYANLIVLAESYLDSAMTIGDDAREGLYEMLPGNLKMLVRSKLRKSKGDAPEAEDDESLAEGWRQALREIMGWLAPMAHDTLTWQSERSLEKIKFGTKPTVLLLHTLHFSDREKTEAAIAEVLVGLSYIYRYENHWNCGYRDDWHSPVGCRFP